MLSNQIIGTEKVENERERWHRLILLGVLVSPISLAAALPYLVHAVREYVVSQLYIICPFLTITGLPCPFCGLTGSLLSLLQGEFAQAFWHHPLGPLIWGGLALSVFSSLMLLLFKRRFKVKIPGNFRTVSIAAIVLLLWVGNILFGHH